MHPTQPPGTGFDFDGELPARAPHAAGVSLRLHVDPAYVLGRWSLCGVIANFVAAFLLHGRGRSPAQAASNVFNEIVENAVKYAAPGSAPVALHAWAGPWDLGMETRQECTEEQCNRLIDALRAMREHPTEALIVARFEDPQVSGVGLVSLVREFGAEVDAQIRRPANAAGLHEVTLRVQIPLDRLEDDASGQ